jgi:uncharacterized protein (TIGR02145 family)
LTCSPTYPVRGICPYGWHLPDSTEWKKLIKYGGFSTNAGKRLRTASWVYVDDDRIGTDDYKFTALPAGYRLTDGKYSGLHYFTNYWSSNEDGRSSAYSMYLSYERSDALLVNDYHSYKATAYSVRCIKN